MIRVISFLATFFLTIATVHAAEILVHKNVGCMCCDKWATHLRAYGHQVTLVEDEEIFDLKETLNIPEELWSCHTGRVGNYFIEGHVPVEDVERLLRENRDALGLAVAGMPMGSPGMETNDGRHNSYDVILIKKDGSTEVYAHHA